MSLLPTRIKHDADLYVLGEYFPSLEKLCGIHLHWLDELCEQNR